MAEQILFCFEDNPGDISQTSCSQLVKSTMGWFVSSGTLKCIDGPAGKNGTTVIADIFVMIA